MQHMIGIKGWDEGRIVPKTRRLRLEELANEMQKSTRKIQRDGTSSRVRSGKATEPKPKASK